MSARNQFEGRVLVLTGDFRAQLFLLCQYVSRLTASSCCYFILVLCNFKVSCRCCRSRLSFPTMDPSKGGKAKAKVPELEGHAVRRIEFIVVLRFCSDGV